jgi:mycoredoxin
MTKPVILYAHRTCPDVPPVMAVLRLTKVPFTYVDIRQDEAAAARVREINHGNESVPTLLFPDGTTLTEPTMPQLQSKLGEMGYRVGVWAWLLGRGKMIIFGLILLWALLRFFGFL